MQNSRRRRNRRLFCCISNGGLVLVFLTVIKDLSNPIFYDKIVFIIYPQCTRDQTVRTAKFAVLLRYFQSAYIQYASFKCLAELQI